MKRTLVDPLAPVPAHKQAGKMPTGGVRFGGLTKVAAMATAVAIFAVVRVGPRLDADGWTGAVAVVTIPALLTIVGVVFGLRRRG